MKLDSPLVLGGIGAGMILLSRYPMSSTQIRERSIEDTQTFMILLGPQATGGAITNIVSPFASAVGKTETITMTVRKDVAGSGLVGWHINLHEYFPGTTLSENKLGTTGQFINQAVGTSTVSITFTIPSNSNRAVNADGTTTFHGKLYLVNS